MDLMNPTGLVTADTIHRCGPFSATPVSVDQAVDQLVSSQAPIARVLNGYRNPERVAELISSRLAVNGGTATATLFIARRLPIVSVSGVVVGVNERVVQFADEHKNLQAWPLLAVIALIAE